MIHISDPVSTFEPTITKDSNKSPVANSVEASLSFNEGHKRHESPISFSYEKLYR